MGSLCIQEEGEDGTDAESEASISSGWVEEGVESGNEGDRADEASSSITPEALRHGNRAEMLWCVLEVCTVKHALVCVLSSIGSCKRLALDVHHEGLRSYALGFTCNLWRYCH
jgi:hypothetical protein